MLGTLSRDFPPIHERWGLGSISKWGLTVAPQKTLVGAFPMEELAPWVARVLRGWVAGGGSG